MPVISTYSAKFARLLLAAIGIASITLASANADDHVDVHEYTITVDYALSRLWVEARFARPVTSVRARSGDAGRYLVDARGCQQDPEIHIRNRRMLIPQGGVTCINYTVDLERAARSDRNYRGMADGNVLVSPSHWLWRPEITSRSEIRAEFRLPRDVRVSVPWPQVTDKPNTYRIARSPESSHALAMFGNFAAEDVVVPGAVLRVAIARMDGLEDDVDTASLYQWVAATATDVALTYGRFPNPSPQVVVVPLKDSRGDSPVPYGQVIRDGGETVQLFVDIGRPMTDIMADWTATHEFSHLMVPYLNRKSRWISEGFAQYYQNVLLTRAGSYDERYAWQKIYDGLERGRLSRPELSPNAAAEGGIRTGLMKVYWSGAAIALMADVELRRRSDGRESLDLALSRLQNCCLPGDRVWSGAEFFSKLDSLVSEPIFMPLYRRYADTAGFPDTSALFAQLGIKVTNGEVRFRRDGELVSIRAAITRDNTNPLPNHRRTAAR